MSATIAIWGDNRMLGIRCAQLQYDRYAIEEVLRGDSYHGKNGRLLVRMREGQISEDDYCQECMKPLFVCNASEVTV